MASRTIQWINSPVLLEAMLRYEEGRLPRSMRLWVEQIFELDGSESQTSLLPHVAQGSIE